MAIELWTQVYCQGEKYQRQTAVTALDKLLPADQIAREKAVAGLQGSCPRRSSRSSSPTCSRATSESSAASPR